MTYRRGSWYLLRPGPRPPGDPRCSRWPGSWTRCGRRAGAGRYQVPEVDLDGGLATLEPSAAGRGAHCSRSGRVGPPRPAPGSDADRRARRGLPAGFDAQRVSYARRGRLRRRSLCPRSGRAGARARGASENCVIDQLTAVAGVPAMTSADQVARLLSLVPYLQAQPDADSRPTAAAVLRCHRPAAAGRPEGALVLRPARGPAGRPDRDRHGRGGGHRPDPAVQRRLPGPADAFHPRRGDEPDGRAAGDPASWPGATWSTRSTRPWPSSRRRTAPADGSAGRLRRWLRAARMNSANGWPTAIEARTSSGRPTTCTDPGQTATPLVEFRCGSPSGTGTAISRRGASTGRTGAPTGWTGSAALRETDHRGSRTRAADARARRTGWLDERSDAALVTLELGADAAWITEYYPTGRSRATDSGWIEVDLLVADPAWLRSLLLRLGREVRAVDPSRPPDGRGSSRGAA